MQTKNTVMDQGLDSFSEKGSTDAKLNHEVNVDQGKIKPAARNIYYEIKAQFAGAAEQAKMQYQHTESRIKRLRSELQSIKDNSWSHVNIPDSSSFRPQTIDIDNVNRAWIGFAYETIEDSIYSSGVIKVLKYTNLNFSDNQIKSYFNIGFGLQ